jgi:hypothetical protein
MYLIINYEINLSPFLKSKEIISKMIFLIVINKQEEKRNSTKNFF